MWHFCIIPKVGSSYFVPVDVVLDLLATLPCSS